MRTAFEDARRFVYSGRNSRGELVAGEIAAASRATALRTLHDRHRLSVLSLGEPRELFDGGASIRAGLLHAYYGLSLDKAKLTLYRQLAKFLRAGAPIDTALARAAESCANPRLRETLRTMLSSFLDGRPSTLSGVMAQHDHDFSAVEVAMVEAAQAGAGFAAVLERLAAMISQRRRIQSKVGKALVYPVFVLLGIGGFLVYMTTRFVPQFAAFTRAMGQPVPAELSILTALGGFVMSPFGLLLSIGVLIGGTAAFGALLRVPGVALSFDGAVLRIPVVGQLRRRALIGTFCRVYGSLLAAAVPIDRALEYAGATLASPVFRRAIGTIASNVVTHGNTFSRFAKETGVFDGDFIALVGAGEASTAQVEIFLTLAAEYDLEVSESLEGLSAVVEPALIVLMGGAVTFILQIVYGSLYSVIGNVR